MENLNKVVIAEDIKPVFPTMIHTISLIEEKVLKNVNIRAIKVVVQNIICMLKDEDDSKRNISNSWKGKIILENCSKNFIQRSSILDI